MGPWDVALDSVGEMVMRVKGNENCSDQWVREYMKLLVSVCDTIYCRSYSAFPFVSTYPGNAKR